MNRTVLFDLDGTLLPMDQEVFAKAYFRTLAEAVGPLGYEPEKLVKAIWTSTAAMVRNDGSKTNEEAFWEDFETIFGKRVREDLPAFNRYYEEGFQKVEQVCGKQPLVQELMEVFHKKNLKPVLATNPIFPHVATYSRIRWAGMQPEEFSYITTYENSTHCKPNPAYYQDIVEQLHLDPSHCLMVGNDTEEDLAAQKTGMQVFIVTDCMIDTKHVDLSSVPHGTFSEMIAYVKDYLTY